MVRQSLHERLPDEVYIDVDAEMSESNVDVEPTAVSDVDWVNDFGRFYLGDSDGSSELIQKQLTKYIAGFEERKEIDKKRPSMNMKGPLPIESSKKARRVEVQPKDVDNNGIIAYVYQLMSDSETCDFSDVLVKYIDRVVEHFDLDEDVIIDSLSNYDVVHLNKVYKKYFV